jgi:hypothetical protein
MGLSVARYTLQLLQHLPTRQMLQDKHLKVQHSMSNQLDDSCCTEQYSTVINSIAQLVATAKTQHTANSEAKLACSDASSQCVQGC